MIHRGAGMLIALWIAGGLPAMVAAQGGNAEDTAFRRAEATFAGGRYYDAYYEYETFVRRYPESKRLREAIRKEMESARAVAEVGHEESVLGIPLFKSSETGLGLLRQSLQRHPFEDFSDDYSLWIANFFYKEEKWNEAVLEYESFTKVYPNSELYPSALFQLGRCYLRRFDSVEYDTKPLRKARKFFERLELQYPYFDKIKEAKQYLAFIREKEAEKLMLAADFYHGRGKHRSEAVYLKMIVKEYPTSETAKEAQKRLAEFQDLPDKASPSPQEQK